MRTQAAKMAVPQWHGRWLCAMFLCLGLWLLSSSVYAQSNNTCNIATGAGTSTNSSGLFRHLCWLDMAGFSSAIAGGVGGQNFTFNLPDGSSLTFTIQVNAPPNVGTRDDVPAPSFAGAALGTGAYTGIGGRPILRATWTGGDTSTAVFTITNIVYRDPLGNIIPDFQLIVADGESTNDPATRPPETLNFQSNVIFSLIDLIDLPNGAVTVTGVGTTTVNQTGTDATNNGDGRLYAMTAPTQLTTSMQSPDTGSQAFAMALVVSYASLRKVISPARIAAADQFNYTIGDEGTRATVTGATAGTGTTGPTVTSLAYFDSNQLSFNETMAAGSADPITDYGNSYACTPSSSGAGTGFNIADPVPSIAGATSGTTPPAGLSGATWACTFTNVAPTLTLIKTVTNDNGGTSAPSAWTLTATGPTTPISGTTGSAAVTNRPVKPGTYALSESGPANYTASPWSCTGTGSATGGNAALAAGQTLTCTINNNDAIVADLSITKTNAGTTVVSGSTTTYMLTVTNQGPGTVDSAVLQDTPGAGLNCPASNPVTCSGTGCPASPNPIQVSHIVSGLTLGTLTSGSSLQLQFTCDVL